MVLFWRLVGAAGVIGVVYAFAEHVDPVMAVVVLAVIVVIQDIVMQQRLDRISKALEMQSKKLFPEAWED